MFEGNTCRLNTFLSINLNLPCSWFPFSFPHSHLLDGSPALSLLMASRLLRTCSGGLRGAQAPPGFSPCPVLSNTLIFSWRDKVTPSPRAASSSPPKVSRWGSGHESPRSISVQSRVGGGLTGSPPAPPNRLLCTKGFVLLCPSHCFVL